MNSKRSYTAYASHYFVGVVSTAFLTFASTQEVEAQTGNEEFTTNEQSITNGGTYIMKDMDGWYMKAGYDATNRLRLLSTRLQNEATPFTFKHWFSDYYFASIQMEGDTKCYLARDINDIIVFNPGYTYDTELYGWDCSTGNMSLLTIKRGWSTNYYLYCDNGSWGLNSHNMSTIIMQKVDSKGEGKEAGGGGSVYTGIEELESSNSLHSIYTLSGARLKETPKRHGIYIVDGHKIAY